MAVVILVLPAAFMIFDKLICKTSIGFIDRKRKKGCYKMNQNRKIKRGVTAGIAAGMTFILGTLPVCAADSSISKDETVYVNADASGTQR